ncbi:MAG: hypothetical protein LDL56_10160 [Armatimonadetes bacterium]|nr:hypothetical protein [Armatimonadota bacterium]
MVERLVLAIVALAALASGCGQHPDQEGTPMKPATLDESLKQKGFSAEEQQSIGARGH